GCGEAPPQNTPTYWGGGTRKPPTMSPTMGGEGPGGGAPAPSQPNGGENPKPVDASAPPPPPPMTMDASSSVDAGAASVDTRPSTVDSAPDVRSAPSMCNFQVASLTRTMNRGYYPRNVGALWIADSTGKFIKSLNVWGNRRLNHLERWVAATRAAGSNNNRVDAVTAATMNSHAMRMGTWNCTNFAGMVVPDGDYQACFEINETSNSMSLVDCVRFTKAGAAFRMNPPDTGMFTMRVLNYTP
ncbi:MAG TPA: DUF2271 domain-containing protein, partial [Polyangia bacterium]